MRNHNSVRRIATVVGLLVAVGFASAAVADIRLPAVFSDYMVLQRDVSVPVWGWADPGEGVAVGIAGQSKQVTADSDGRWSLRLEPLPAGGPHELTVRGKNTVQVADVLVGEVWLCSGQSNMALNVSRVVNAEREIAAADIPHIRMFTMSRSAAVEPETDCRGDWKICSPETVGAFSATAYFFGRTLHQELDVPVGLINASWGGTAVEAWTNPKVQENVSVLAPVLQVWKDNIAHYDPDQAAARYEKQISAWKEASTKAKSSKRRVPRKPSPPKDPRLNQNRPGNLYNGMIAPLIPYALRGAIWYQGERNSHGDLSRLYGLQLQTLIKNWRDEWHQGEFPFLFVQLPNFMTPQEQPSETTGWVMVREGMLKTLSLPNTGMAITVDIGEANNIHPKNKQDVGTRLAAWALAKTYGRDGVVSGPIYKSMHRQGTKIVIRFDYVHGGLTTRDHGPVKGFAIAGAERNFVKADAQIEGSTVVVSSPIVPAPVAIRYAWASNPDCNLVNTAHFPASPFRTDNWKVPIVGR